MRLLSSIALLILTFAASAQKVDTVRKDYRPTGLRLGTDAISLVRNAYDESFKGWEVNADVDFNRYYFALDYGNWARTLNHSDSSIYKNDGKYFRIGADVNFLLKDPDKNMLFFGFRYGQSTFTENLTTTIYDPLWGSINNKVYTNDNGSAHWLELTTGLRVKMWKNFWMGYTARYKFGLSVAKSPEMVTTDVPGYGATYSSSYWGFNYQLFWRIPIRKEKSTPPKQ